MAAVNNMVRKYGALDAVFCQVDYAHIPMAVVGIVMKFFQIVISVSVGAAALLIVELSPGGLTGVFGASNESPYYMEYGIRCFRIYLCMMPLATVNKGTFIYLQSLGKAFASAAISLVREVVFGVGFALLLPVRFGLDGVLYSMPASDVLTFIIFVQLLSFIRIRL